MAAVLPAAVPVPRAVAAVDCAAARITWPDDGAAVAGRVSVYGSASIDAFQFYKLEFAAAAAPEAWSATSDVVRAAARHARLDGWATDAVPDGAYRLKLTVVDTASQERCRVVVERLVVANGAARSAAGDAAGDGDIDRAGDGTPGARPAVVARAIDAAPWPTASDLRPEVQASDPVTPSVESAPTVVQRSETDASAGDVVTETRKADAPVTTTVATSDTAATSGSVATDTATSAGDRAASAPGAGAGRAAARFAWPFAIAFVSVALLLAILGRRASRGIGGESTRRR